MRGHLRQVLPTFRSAGEARLRRSHRLILLGAYVVARQAQDAAIRRLPARELPGFVNARAHPKRQRDLLAAFPA